MITLSSVQAIRACGLVWMLGGFSLLRKGLILSSELANQGASTNAVSGLYRALLSWLHTSERASIFLIVLGISLGLLKAKAVMSKAASKNAQRLVGLQQVSLIQIFDPKLWIIIAAMMGLALVMTKIGVPTDWRSVVDIAVGTALIQGASHYFRLARVPAAVSKS